MSQYPFCTYYHTHFPDEAVETQRRWISCPPLISKAEFQPNKSSSKLHAKLLQSVISVIVHKYFHVIAFWVAKPPTPLSFSDFCSKICELLNKPIYFCWLLESNHSLRQFYALHSS